MSSRVRRATVGALAGIVCGAALVVPPTPAVAASGDFSLNLVASAPYSYPHLTGGGAFDDGTKGKSADIVESLEGGDFACGDIVTFLTKVGVGDTTSAGDDGPQTIEVDYQFLMNTTGQSGAGLSEIVHVGVNYAPVVDLIAGENTVDEGIVDDGGSVATLVSTSTTGPLFSPGSVLNGTVQVTDLERAEQVVVRVDVRLECQPGSSPTGNLQAAVTGARLTTVRGSTPVTPAQTINVGNQTIPFLKLGDLDSGGPVDPPVVDLVVEKSADRAAVDAGGSLTYTITVLNEGPAEARDVVVTDVLPTGTTFTSGSAGCTAVGQTVTCELGTVPAGATRSVTLTVAVASYAEGAAAHDHQLHVTKVESHLSLAGGASGEVTTTCPGGMVATDGSVRMDAVDQGTGTFASAFVAASRVTAEGTGWTGVVTNHATGQLQGKVNVVCASTTTVSGEGHVHPLVITDPAGASRTDVELPVGTTEVEVTCEPGSLPVAPSFTLHSGAGVVTTRHPAPGTFVFVARMTEAGTGDFSVRCLSTELGEVDGHRHDLGWSELTDTVTVPAGGTAAPRLTCPDGYKGVTAWADIEGVWMGSDPQPITREFRFFNPGAAEVTATFGLLCLAVRSGGLRADLPLVNTATATTSSVESDLSDNSGSASVVVRALSAAPRAHVGASGRASVTVRIGSLAPGTARVELVADRRVRGTGIRRGTTLARSSTVLVAGEQDVALRPSAAARRALASGRIHRARLVIRTEDGQRRALVVRLVGPGPRG